MNEYIDFAVAPYALVDTLMALNNTGIKEFFVTKEDNDLHIRIKVAYIYKALSPNNDKSKDLPTCNKTK